jgi:hypothetical protein
MARLLQSGKAYKEKGKFAFTGSDESETEHGAFRSGLRALHDARSCTHSPSPTLRPVGNPPPGRHDGTHGTSPEVAAGVAPPVDAALPLAAGAASAVASAAEAPEQQVSGSKRRDRTSTDSEQGMSSGCWLHCSCYALRSRHSADRRARLTKTMLHRASDTASEWAYKYAVDVLVKNPQDATANYSATATLSKKTLAVSAGVCVCLSLPPPTLTLYSPLLNSPADWGTTPPWRSVRRRYRTRRFPF